ncbi:MAG: hypothetical protein IJX94_05910, partial [Clostridia bacterium]|nr:hypothetical protein [Clostridia bacterium]
MFIIDWWNSLSTAAQIFACAAIPATVILLIQTVLLFLGIGGEDDGIGEGLNEIGDAPPDDLPDGSHGVFGDNDVADVSDSFGWDGIRIFTFRGIIAFFVVFGWVGIVMDGTGAKLWATLPVAALCGFAMMLLLAILLRAAMRLRSDGNTDNRNAIGSAGKVYLTIPAARSGEGKIYLMLQGSYVERNAVTDDEEPIPTGTEIVVVGVSGQTDLVV